MGMIDKKKLIEKTKYVRCADEVRLVIENFPEEPEIDFDALYREFNLSCLKKQCHVCDELSCKSRCFLNFLKSKHLTAQKKRQIPVKKVWTLKKEYEDFCTEFLLQSVKTVMSVEPVGASKKYYDLTETPDYSQVKVGDVVEVYHSLSNKPNYGIVQRNSDNTLSIICNMHSINAFCINYSHIKSLTILKAAE